MRKLLLVVLCLIAAAPAIYGQKGRESELYAGNSNVEAEGVPDRDDTTDVSGGELFGGDKRKRGRRHGHHRHHHHHGKRSEFYVGYANIQAEGIPDRDDPAGLFTGGVFGRRRGLNGADVQAAVFFDSVFGFKADFSVTKGVDRAAISDGTSSANTTIFYFIGGPVLKFRNRSQVEPFIHGLVGGAHTRFKLEKSFDIPGGIERNSIVTSSTDLAAAFGGGLDVRIGERLSIRLIQVDYAPVFLRSRSVHILGEAGAIVPFTLEGERLDNIRFSCGIVF